MAAWTTAGASIAVALIAALFAYRNADAMHRKQQRLARLNLQLGEFYGPLFSLVEVGEAAWRQFRKDFRPGISYLFADGELTDEEHKKWVQWMRVVFMPTNRRMYDLIVNKSHLLVEPQMPQCMVDFCAHVATYEVILAQWDAGDESQVGSALPWPLEFRPYVREMFRTLKQRQLALLPSSDEQRHQSVTLRP